MAMSAIVANPLSWSCLERETEVDVGHEEHEHEQHDLDEELGERVDRARRQRRCRAESPNR